MRRDKHHISRRRHGEKGRDHCTYISPHTASSPDGHQGMQCVRSRACTHTHIYIHTHMHARARAHTHTHTQIIIYTYMHTHTHTRVHTHTHTPWRRRAEWTRLATSIDDNRPPTTPRGALIMMRLLPACRRCVARRVVNGLIHVNVCSYESDDLLPYTADISQTDVTWHNGFNLNYYDFQESTF